MEDKLDGIRTCLESSGTRNRWGSRPLSSAKEAHMHHAERELSDGRVISVTAMTFGKGRLSIGKKGEMWYDDQW